VFIGAVLLTVATLHAAGNIPRPLVTTDNLSTDGTIAVETTEWKLVFDEHFNGGISQAKQTTWPPMPAEATTARVFCLTTTFISESG
jgi:hypothetical protein